jgi:SAM-dependent methyltransferase
MKKFLLYSSVILDAGCGRRAQFFSDLPRNAWAIGLDIDRENVEKAKKTNSGIFSFIVGSLQNLPLVEEAVDLIVCCDVLEHVREPHKAIKELAMVLRRGGMLLITTTNVLNPVLFADIRFSKISETLIKRFGDSPPLRRTHRFSPWTLAREIGKHGLTMKLCMFGDPPIGKPWLYHSQRLKLPKIYYVWIVFDKMTNVKILRKFKEVMLAIVKKP